MGGKISGIVAGVVLGWAGVGMAVPSVGEALAAGRDVWGEGAMGQANGASYEYFEKLMPPLRYVNTAFRAYPIMLAAPMGVEKVRVVSDGSGVNVPAGMPGKVWYDYPVGVTISVGGEKFGGDVKRLKGPVLERGYLPVVRMEYGVGGATVVEEVFVPVEGVGAANGGAVVRLSVVKGEVPVELGVVGTVEGAVWLGAGWVREGMKVRGVVGEGKALVFAVFSKPVEESAPHAGRLNGVLGEEAYWKMREGCVAGWEGILKKCVGVEVPEERVNRAWKATVIANLMMASGDQMSYSAGNCYQRLYEAESGDAVRALMLYGLSEEAGRLCNPLMTYIQKGLGFHDSAFKLQLLAHYYWVTRDAAFVRERRGLWRAAVDLILARREKGSGLLPRENYCGDINTQVYSLNSNANCWRGLRDMAAVLKDMGEEQEAKEIGIVAAEFKGKILAALGREEEAPHSHAGLRGFVPIAMFGEEKPYEHLTDSKMGSYWDLMIPYVLGSGILDEKRERGAMDYLQAHGGICMGMIRFDQHSGLFANEKGLDDLYGLRYTQALLRRDEVERALVSFYGKLAQGMTRETFVGGEGSSLVALDEGGRPMYLPPNASGNAFFLTTLRELMVQEVDEDGDGGPDVLRLMFGTPRGWMEDGKVIRAEGMPTEFGVVSVVARSELGKGRVVTKVVLGARPGRVELRARVPAGWRVTGARVGETKLKVDERGTVVLPGGLAEGEVEFSVLRG